MLAILIVGIMDLIADGTIYSGINAYVVKGVMFIINCPIGAYYPRYRKVAKLGPDDAVRGVFMSAILLAVFVFISPISP